MAAETTMIDFASRFPKGAPFRRFVEHRLGVEDIDEYRLGVAFQRGSESSRVNHSRPPILAMRIQVPPENEGASKEISEAIGHKVIQDAFNAHTEAIINELSKQSINIYPINDSRDEKVAIISKENLSKWTANLLVTILSGLVVVNSPPLIDWRSNGEPSQESAPDINPTRVVYRVITDDIDGRVDLRDSPSFAKAKTIGTILNGTLVDVVSEIYGKYEIDCRVLGSEFSGQKCYVSKNFILPFVIPIADVKN